MTPDLITAGMADTFDVAAYMTGFVALLFAPRWLYGQWKDWRFNRMMRRDGLRWPT